MNSRRADNSGNSP